MAAGTHHIRIDRSKPLRDEPHTGHNRWHPDIPSVLSVDPGDTVVLETRDAFDGVVTPPCIPFGALRPIPRLRGFPRGN